ncbi:MAG: hypothetical protein M1826_004032 [Phylliscum demangeonii]|nr:MAG: hypothetical protein M1826_004032 [Phylliscum demangeonii]
MLLPQEMPPYILDLQELRLDNFWLGSLGALFCRQTQLVTLDLNHCALSHSKVMPHRLRSLNLTHTGALQPPPSLDELATWHWELPDLEVLELKSSNFIPAAILSKLLDTAGSKLRKLAVSARLASGQLVRDRLAEGLMMGALKELELVDGDVYDDDIELIAPQVPRLERLNLWNTRVTGVAVKILLTRPDSRLSWLGLENCSLVSPDAVEWARARGYTWGGGQKPTAAKPVYYVT